MDRATKILRNKVIPLVKVLWERSHPGEANWELESEMQEAYPYLFQVFSFENSRTNFMLRDEGNVISHILLNSSFVSSWIRLSSYMLY